MSLKYVTIYYGPVESFQLYTEHRPQFLRGLKDQLLKHGFRVDLARTDYTNYCMLAVCGHKVFECNIKSLCFNTPMELDPVCRNAVNAVLEATEKFARARNYLWSWSLVDTQIFKRSELAPKDYWVVDLEPIPAPLADDCLKCCNMFIEDVDPQKHMKDTAEVTRNAVEAYLRECNDIFRFKARDEGKPVKRLSF